MKLKGTCVSNISKLLSFTQIKISRNDIIAGITGAVVGTPQAMGFALIAGISPIYGLYTAFVSTIIASFIVRSSLMTVGPTNALALVVFSTLGQLTGDSQIEALITLTILVGIFQVAFGLLGMQRYVRFVSHAVMTGFITGAAFLIMLGQVAHITGYHRPPDFISASPVLSQFDKIAGLSKTVPNFIDWIVHFQQWDMTTTILGVSGIITMILIRRTRFKLLSALIAIVSLSVVVFSFDLQSVRIVSDVSAIPSGLPLPAMPNLLLIPELIPVALATAVLALVQSVGITQSIAEIEDIGLDDKRDFLGQGIANIVGGFFQNMPSGGSLSRTAININAGAQTRASNIFSAVLVALILIFLNRVVEQIVLVALAAQLIIAAIGLVRLSDISHVWRVSKSGRMAMVITFLATLFLPLEYSIFIGVVLHLGHYVRSSSDHVQVVALDYNKDQHSYREIPAPKGINRPITLLSVTGNLFYAGIPLLKQQLPIIDNSQPAVVIFRMRNVWYLGTTGIRLMSNYARELQNNGGKLILCGVNSHIIEQLRIYDDAEVIRDLEIYPSEDTIFDSLHRAWLASEEWLATQTD
jgi:sulfate permease, SulP family